jgi:hypothetical protein
MERHGPIVPLPRRAVTMFMVCGVFVVPCLPRLQHQLRFGFRVSVISASTLEGRAW